MESELRCDRVLLTWCADWVGLSRVPKCCSRASPFHTVVVLRAVLVKCVLEVLECRKFALACLWCVEMYEMYEMYEMSLV